MGVTWGQVVSHRIITQGHMDIGSHGVTWGHVWAALASSSTVSQGSHGIITQGHMDVDVDMDVDMDVDVDVDVDVDMDVDMN
eukprot:5103027-Prymnesium_polylepis.2